jgi:glycosyltransferase involved in cell wall biosynthesis
MKVAFLLSLPYPRVSGGGERWVHEASLAMAKRVDLTVHYLACRGGGSPPSGAQRHWCWVPPVREGYRFALAPGLPVSIRSADVVHVHQFGSLTAQIAAITGRLAGASIFVTDHGSSGVELGRKLRLDHLFDGFLEVSEFSASFAPPDRRRVVYGGADLNRFAPGLRAESPFALFVGRLMPHKGVDWLIRAMPHDARLVIAGRPDPDNASYLEFLRRLAESKRVDFVLGGTDEELAALYASAWVTVLPTVWRDVYGRSHRVPELLGLTVLEAMASGTPVICSDVGPLPELVISGETGIVVESGNERALQDALRQCLSNRARTNAMGANARQAFLDRYTWDRVADRCLEAYVELGRGRRMCRAGGLRQHTSPPRSPR